MKDSTANKHPRIRVNSTVAPFKIKVAIKSEQEEFQSVAATLAQDIKLGGH